MDERSSNSIAESSKESKTTASVVSNAHINTNNSNSILSPSTTTDDLRNAAERISNDIASTFTNFGAALTSQLGGGGDGGGATASTTSSTTKGGREQSKGFIDACWLVPDEPAILTTQTAIAGDPRRTSAVPGIKKKLLPIDDNSSFLQVEESTSPMQRIRRDNNNNNKNSNNGDNNSPNSKNKDLDAAAEETPSSPSRRSQGEVLESWKRKMKLAQKEREKEANELLTLEKDDQIADDNDNDTKTDADEYSFIKAEDDTIFKEEDDNNSQLKIMRACQPSTTGRSKGKDDTVLDPIFSAAMTLEGIPNSRQEFIDLVTGKCRVMIGADEPSSTSSEETDEWSDSYMTPESPRHKRRNHNKDRQGKNRGSSSSGRNNKSRRGRSRDNMDRRGTNSKSPQRKSRQSINNDDSASAVHSEITMTPERNREYQRPVSPSSPRRQEQQQHQHQQHQRTPPPNGGEMNTPDNNNSKNNNDNIKKRSAMKTTPSHHAPAVRPKSTSPKDKNFIKEFIHEISHQGCRMMWYREPPSKHPTTVVLFLQHGHKSHVNSNHQGPAMVWVDQISEQDQFYGVNLFDIRALDRSSHHHHHNSSSKSSKSYADPSRSIYLRLAKGNEFIFEAPSEQEAFRFVHGMKWVIARLAFNLVIGNMDVVCELVDVDKRKGEATVARAMDDVTLQMVDKSILKIVQ